MRKLIIIFGVLLVFLNSKAQTVFSKYGYTLPVQTTMQTPLKAMLVFIQKADGTGSVINASSDWPAFDIPADADDYFDNKPV